MKNKIVFLIISLFIFYSCFTEKKAMRPLENRINFFFTYVMKINDAIVRDTFNMYITNNKEYVIYEIPYHVTSEINNILIYDSLKYEFFIYDSTKKYGYSFKNVTDSLGLQINKDSFLKSRAMLDLDMSTITKTFNITGTSETKLGNEAIHKYYIADTLTDSSYYYYNDSMKDIKFSLSRSLDSKYHSKLYKIVNFYKKDMFNSSKEFHEFNGMKMEIKKVPSVNLVDIKILIEKIKKSKLKK